MKHLIDGLKTLLLMAAATGLNAGVLYLTNSPYNIAIIYLLAIMLIARFTRGYFWGIFSSVVSIICINFFFTYPYNKLDFSISGYPITFVVMLLVAVLTSAMTTNVRERETLLVESEKEKTRANLLRAISHDLRTPLTSIIGSSATLLENPDLLTKEEQTGMVTRIHEDANWLLHMVENLLSITRIHEDAVKVTKTPEPVEEVVSEAVSRLKKRYHDARIQVAVPDEFLMVPMDATLIEQVIINLLENAVKYSQSTRPIQMTVKKKAGEVLFQVTDFGKGLSQEELASISCGDFLRQRKNTMDKNKGMGIGLSICQTIVHAHGGRLTGENHKEGARFSFTLPLEERT